MKKNIFQILLIMIIFLNFISGSISSINECKVGTDMILPQTCSTCTYNNVTTIITPNSTIITLNLPMDKSGTDYSLLVTGGNFTQSGTYIINGIGDKDGVDTNWNYELSGCNSVGTKFETSKSIIYVVYFFILIFFFIIVLLGIHKLPSGNARDIEGRILSISRLKYFRPVLWFFEWLLLILMMFVASNLGYAYLGETLFANTFFTFYKIMFGLTPLMILVWLAWAFYNIFEDKKLKRLMSRGFF